jgi:hypothetical protein
MIYGLIMRALQRKPEHARVRSISMSHPAFILLQASPCHSIVVCLRSAYPHTGLQSNTGDVVLETHGLPGYEGKQPRRRKRPLLLFYLVLICNWKSTLSAPSPRIYHAAVRGCAIIIWRQIFFDTLVIVGYHQSLCNLQLHTHLNKTPSPLVNPGRSCHLLSIFP